MREDLFAVAARLTAAGRRFALVTVVRTRGSTPRKAGAKMIVAADGEQHGSVGGGRIEQLLVEEARAALAAGEARLVGRHLTRDLAMCCGGEMEAFIDLGGQRDTFVLVGAGHVSAALAPVVARLGFEVVVADELEEMATPPRFPDAARLVHDFEPERWGVPLDGGACVVVATREHALDERVLERLAAAGAAPAYLGVIGSRRKMARLRMRLAARGVAPEWVARVRGPVGLAIGAETPEEIAIAIAAEVVALRRGAALAAPGAAAESA